MLRFHQNNTNNQLWICNCYLASDDLMDFVFLNRAQLDKSLQIVRIPLENRIQRRGQRETTWHIYSCVFRTAENQSGWRKQKKRRVLTLFFFAIENRTCYKGPYIWKVLWLKMSPSLIKRTNVLEKFCRLP